MESFTGTTFTDTYIIHRRAASTMSGCSGAALYDRLSGVNPNKCAQLRPLGPEELVGRNLGDGTLVRVTVEVLHEVPLSEKCINPWGHHREHERRRDLEAA